MRGKVLRICESNNWAVVKCINFMYWRPSFQRRRIEISGRIAKKYALKLFSNAKIWHVLVDLIFYGQWISSHDPSQNGPRLVTNDCLVWSLTFITHVNINSIVMCETLPNNADWDCFKTPILQEILRIQNLHQVEHCAFLEAIRLVPISWMCKKQTSVSHSSTESEIISLDAGLRMDGIPALDLWNLIVTVLPTRKKFHGMFDDLDNVDFISSNVQSSRKILQGCVVSRTTSQVTLPINKHCATPPKEESGPLAKTTSSTDTHSKSSSGQGMGKIGENSGVGSDPSQKQIRGDRGSKDEGRKSSFCIIYGHLSFEECRIGDKAPEIQRSSCAPRWYCKRQLWFLCSIHRTRIFSISNDSRQKSWISSPDCLVAQDKQQTQYLLMPRSKWKMLRNYWKFPRHKWPKSWSSVEDPVVPLERNLYGIVGKAIWENLIEIWLGENSKLGMSLCTSWKRIILICVCGWHKIGWKETKHWSDVESTQ